MANDGRCRRRHSTRSSMSETCTRDASRRTRITSSTGTSRSGEEPEPVRSKLRAAGFQDTQTGKDIYHSLVKYRPDQGGGTTSAGMKLSDLDATPEAASGRLSATGIHGIKYLNQGSRRGIPDADTMLALTMAQDELATATDPARIAALHAELAAHEAKLQQTRNYVVFDDKHIEITHKNGEPVKREELIAENKDSRRPGRHLVAARLPIPRHGRYSSISPVSADSSEIRSCAPSSATTADRSCPASVPLIPEIWHVARRRADCGQGRRLFH